MVAPAQRSVGRFCSVTCNDLTALSLLDGVNMGAGAQAYVLSTGKSYRYSTSSFGTVAPVSIGASGGGTWFEENAVNDQAFFINSTTTSPDASVSANVWRALPSSGGLYAQVAAKAAWAVNVTTGVVNYSGPPATFLVTGVFSVQLIDHSDTWEFDLSRNGAALGGSLSFTSSSRSNDDLLVGYIYNYHLSSPITMVAGQSLQHMVRDVTVSTTATFNLLKYQAIFQLLP